MAKKLTTSKPKEGPLHRKWRQDVEAEIEKSLSMLESRRGKYKQTLRALATSLGVSQGHITGIVAEMRLSFLNQHQQELYTAAKYMGMDTEDMILDAVRMYMVHVQQNVQKNPFPGSPLQQAHQTAKKAELYNHRVATDPNRPDFVV